jgi:hypothetical protein
MKRSTSAIRNVVVAAAAVLLLQACATSCDNYMTYDDILNTWVGHDLDAYERQLDVRASNVMERPLRRLEYTYSTPVHRYDGSEAYCRTWLEADRDTGKIVTWRYEGDCYLHGYCGS